MQIEFEISFFVEAIGSVDPRPKRAVRRRFRRHLAAAGISLTSTQNQPYSPPQAAAARERKNRRRARDRSGRDFHSLTTDERKTLAAKTKQRQYIGDTLVEPGTCCILCSSSERGWYRSRRFIRRARSNWCASVPATISARSGCGREMRQRRRSERSRRLRYTDWPKEDLAPVIGTRPEVSQADVQRIRSASGRG